MEEATTLDGKERALLLGLPLVKFIIHLATLPGYGIFRDELYYLACAARPAFGYVDHPPLSIWLLGGVTAVFGDSLWVIRLLAAFAGAATVLVVGLIARRLGGGTFAQALAMVAAIAAPIYLALDHFYSMNALDLLLWTLAAWALTGVLRDDRPKDWLLLGVVLGLGLLNKISVLWLGFGLLVGLVLTPRRRDLLKPGPWIAGGVAFLLFLPHVIWQIANGWPTLEFIRNATQNKMVDVAPVDFVLNQLLMMGPLAALVWLPGLFYLLIGKKAEPWRMLGWIWVTVFLLLMLSGSSRANYLAASYGWLFAAGGVIWERWSAERRWLRPAAVAAIALQGIFLAPLALPVLPVPTYVAYAQSLGIAPSTEERKELAELPQFFADMHGWEEKVEAVAEVYEGLPPEDREKACIYAQNYGVAGAMEYLGRDHGLPPAIAGHNNYWLWGPGECSGEVLLILGGRREDHEQVFAEVEAAAVIDCGYCMPYENNQTIWVARGPNASFEEVWPRVKHYD